MDIRSIQDDSSSLLSMMPRKRCGNDDEALETRQPNKRFAIEIDSTLKEEKSLNFSKTENRQYENEQQRPAELQTMPYVSEINGLTQRPVEMSAAPDPSWTLCYGMIHNAKIKVLKQEILHESHLNIPPVPNFVQIQLLFEANEVYVGYSAAERIGIVNNGIAAVLRSLAMMNSCRLNAYIFIDLLQEYLGNGPATGNPRQLAVDIVIYGPTTARKDVGNLLSSAGIYLQHPCHQDSNTYYDNPHFLDITKLFGILGLTESMHLGTGTRLANADNLDSTLTDKGDNESVHTKVARIFSSLTRSKALKGVEAGIKVRTPLLAHQKKALDFMAQREVGPIPPEYSLWASSEIDGKTFYQNVITGFQTGDPPNETLGGILADEMGMGKTLVIISTIIRTSRAASSFAGQNNGQTGVPGGLVSGPSPVFSKATLVIVPSLILINAWKSQIQVHCDGSMRVIVYHGRGRETDPKALADCDIVLSTYHTVAAGARTAMSPAFQINWFRIVIDEAHMVRRMSTKLFQAVSSLRAKFRWCLTATPIQNGVEDLASLVAFMQCSTLDTLPEFKKHIMSPLFRGSEGTKNLRILLDSICLRRTRIILDLPDIVNVTKYIRFSLEERMHYDQTIADMSAAIKSQDSLSSDSKRYLGMFQLQLHLRQLCNHGTFQKSFSKPPNEGCQFDPVQAPGLIRKDQKATCNYCGTELEALDDYGDEARNEFTVCGHLLCFECVPRYGTSLQTGPDGSLNCSICDRNLPASYMVRNEISGQSSSASVMESQEFESTGISSKVSSLIDDIKNKGRSGKSIVFSCWTRSLDLVGTFLTRENFKFVRIDGTSTIHQRQTLLNTYESDPEIHILLMTTGTGAVGLNLSIVDVVHILEPQWNPMVEKQAIARVLRLGQRREFRVIRYIVEETAEHNMQSRQVRKLSIAKLGWNENIA